MSDNRGLNPMALWELSRRAHASGHRTWAHALKGLNFWLFRAILPPEVTVGSNLQLNHRGLNVVIHPKTTLGDFVHLQHGVTLANKTWATSKGGELLKIGSRVKIGAGAIVLGPVVIGDGAVIGAGAVVTRDIPPGETWVGNPARPVGGPP